MKAFRIKGSTSDVTECDLCGRVELRGTVVMVDLDADGVEGEVHYFGTSCAAKAAGWTQRDVKALVKVANDAERERQEAIRRAKADAETAEYTAWRLRRFGTVDKWEAAKRAGTSAPRLWGMFHDERAAA
ncbi:hypothetical protein [Kitasatospora purpeofusca]|uniref:hypothetical protein n=1 Tax=Kitasatospora purpeofusca TaxID=67352 RepID=UPI003676B6D3